MLIKFKNKLLHIFLAFLLTGNCLSAPLSINKKNSYLHNKYLKTHKVFSRELCPGGTEEKFDELYKDFRGLGNYIPTLHGGKLDKKTIEIYLGLFKKKAKWIKGNVLSLKSKKHFKDEQIILKKFQTNIDTLLNFKRIYYQSSQLQNRMEAKNNSKKLYTLFKKDFLAFLYERNYLLGFKYPIDHLSLRQKYDLHKNIKTKKNKRLANQVYFYRKIVEDGAQDPDHSRNDIYLRSNLNTMILNLRKPSEILSENIRYDLEDILKRLNKSFKRGVKQHIKRNNEWLTRVKHSESFYKSILKNKVKVGDHFETPGQILKNKSEASLNLKNFVMDNEAKAYIFWSKQDPLLRKIFAIETILINEVGRLDVEDDLERKDVSQVAINRTTLDEYSQFKPSNSLYKVLKNKFKVTDSLISKNKWLNVLFKEGEFSFTYFFIKASLRSFCADMSYSGRKLRDENIFIALNKLKQENYKFEAVRYFSRASMLGRIDMAHLWTGFTGLAERPGKEIKNKRYLLRKIAKREFRYFYNFLSPDQKQYEVIEVDDKTLVFDSSRKKLFHYRNPHYFTYFMDSSE